MIKDKGEKSAGKEDISRVAQPIPGSQDPDLISEAKSLGKSYWIRVSVGFLVMIFLCTLVPNAYLQYKYKDVFSESPCKLCQDLNNITAGCFFNSNYSIVPKTSAFTLHPIKELGFKAHWLSTPCDVCGEVERGDLQICLNQTFAPKKELIGNKKIDFNFSLNFTEGDISS